jgi:alanine dehydrogenase
MKTLVITKRHVARVLTPQVANRAVEKAFKAYGLGQVQMPAKSYLQFERGDLRAMPAYMNGQGFHVAGIKSVNVHPENRAYNLPTVMAVVVLADPETGFPLAILDGTYLTAMRTGAAGALATKLLSKKEANSAGFVGCGSQARTLLACTMSERKLKTIKVWKRNQESQSANEFCRWAKKAFSLQTFTAENIDEVTTNVDILFTTTPARKALVNKVSPGVHINAMGADAKGKQEIHPKILKRAKLVIDDWVQASHSGEINVSLKRRQITRKDIYAALGEIAAGKKKGRTSEKEITIFDSTGLAIQDLACASVVYEKLKDKRGIMRVSLF